MLKISRRNHHAVNILASQHFFRVLEHLRIEVEDLLHLGSSLLPSQAPDIADRDRFHRHLLRSELDHVDMTSTALSASQLSDANAIVRAHNASIGARIHSRCERNGSGLLYERAAIGSFL
jgi:hypothetical protein